MTWLPHSEQLLAYLYKNSKEKISALTDKLGYSRQTISKLRKKLWSTGVIYSPTIVLNPHVLNLQSYFLEIKTNPSEPKILDTFMSIPEIQSIDGILGDYSLIVKCETRTKKEFASILEGYDEKISHWGMFHSYHIIETIDVYKLGGFKIDRSTPVVQIDENKWNLLQQLRRNYNPNLWPIRSSNSDIDNNIETIGIQNLEKINLSREFSRFERDNIIQNYTIKLNRKKMKNYKINYSTKFYVRIKPKITSIYSTLANRMSDEPEIVDLYRTGEEFGLLAVVWTNGLSEFNDFVKKLYSKYRVSNTHSTVVVDENIPTICPPSKFAAELVL